MFKTLFIKFPLITIVSFALVSCGGSNKSSGDSGTVSNGDGGGSNTPSHLNSDVLAKTALSSMAFVNSAKSFASTNVTRTKVLSGVRYKAITQACPNGGEMVMDLGSYDPQKGEMPSKIDIIFKNCKTIQQDTESSINGHLEMSLDVSNPGSNTNYTFTIDNAYFIEKNERLDIKDYKIVSTGNDKKSTMEVEGSFKTTTCLDQWINFKTLVPVVVLTGDSCPTAGKMSIEIAQSTTSITYNSDQSIDISGNGTSQHYDNCTDLDNVDDSAICQ